MLQRLKIITLTATTTATLLLLGVVGYATLAPRLYVGAPTHADAADRRLIFLFTPKAINDFKNPTASVRALYDALPPLAPTDQLTFILAVGSNDHILRYGPSQPPQPWPVRLAESLNYSVSQQTDRTGLASFRIEPRGNFMVKLQTTVPITPTTALARTWQADQPKNIVTRFFVKNVATGETDTLTYRAHDQELRAGFDRWEDFLLDEPTPAAATQTIAVTQDLFRKRTPDQNTHLVEQEAWVITALEFEGSADVFGFSTPQQIDGGINWARTVYSNNEITQPLAQRARRYPQILSYQDIRQIVTEIKQEGQRRNRRVSVLDALEGSTEFSRQDWLYGLHPEALFIPDRPALPTFDIAAKLNNDTNIYAAFPQGIPADTGSGEFLIKQTQRYAQDMDFDGLYLMNAFGTKGAWYPQRATGISSQPALLNFFQRLRQALPQAYILWMDSYYPRWVEDQHYGIPDAFYDLIDGLQISTFWQDDFGQAVIRWNPEGMFGTMRDTITSKINLKKDHPRLDIFGTFYVRDPWYPFGYEEKTATEWYEHNRSALTGLIVYSLNDAYGEIKKLPDPVRNVIIDTK